MNSVLHDSHTKTGMIVRHKAKQIFSCYMVSSKSLPDSIECGNARNTHMSKREA